MPQALDLVAEPPVAPVVVQGKGRPIAGLPKDVEQITIVLGGAIQRFVRRLPAARPQQTDRRRIAVRGHRIEPGEQHIEPAKKLVPVHPHREQVVPRQRTHVQQDHISAGKGGSGDVHAQHPRRFTGVERGHQPVDRFLGLAELPHRHHDEEYEHQRGQSHIPPHRDARGQQQGQDAHLPWVERAHDDLIDELFRGQPRIAKERHGPRQRLQPGVVP